MITITPYELEEDRGTIRQKRKTVIRVGVEPSPECRQFQERADMDNYRHLRGLIPQRELVVLTDEGDIDTDPTEAAIQTNYATHYAHLESIAVDWVVGMTLTRNQPVPVRHNGKLYDVETSHTVVDPNHTPAVVPALYTEIPSPTPGLDCVAWYVPTSTKNYSKGECMAYTDGFYYESKINDNVWSPEAYPAGWEQLGPIG